MNDVDVVGTLFELRCCPVVTPVQTSALSPRWTCELVAIRLSAGRASGFLRSPQPILDSSVCVYVT